MGMLSDLYYGRVEHAKYKDDADCNKAYQRAERAQEDLETMLDPQTQKLFKEYLDAEKDIRRMDVEENYECGFKNGIRFAYEVLSDIVPTHK